MKKLFSLLCVLSCVFAWAATMKSTSTEKQPAKAKAALASTTEEAAYPTVWVLGEMGIPQPDGSENQVGYRPDVGIKMSTTDGNIYTARVHFYNVAGAPTHNFGFCKTETLAASPADWNAIANYRFGAATPNTSVYFGRPQNVGKLAASKENFFVIATGTYDITLNMADQTMTAVPTTEYQHLYVMGGSVEGQPNAANAGTELATADGVNYKQEVTFTNAAGTPAAFTFSTKLGSAAGSWDEIASERFGATAANTAVTLKQEVAFGENGASKDNSFTIAPGTYELNVNMSTRTMKVTPKQFPPLYILGRVVGQVWSPTQGTAMQTTDGNIYTAQVVMQKEDSRKAATFGFSTQLASAIDWNQIADYRIGYVDNYGNDGYPVPFGKTIKLGKQGATSKENFLGVPDGEYIFTVNLAEGTLKVDPVGKTYDRLFILGNTATTDASGNKKYQVWAADQGTELYTSDFVNYKGSVTFEDDKSSANVTFGFSTKLGADFTKWNDIANNRFGAVTNNTNVTLDTDIVCGEFLASKENKFVIPAGTYDVSVNLTTRTMRITKTSFTNVYVLGRLIYPKDGKTYFQPSSPKYGYQLDTEDGEVYTGQITTGDDLGNPIVNISFSTRLSTSEVDWNSIAAYRFAAAGSSKYFDFNTEMLLGEDMVSKENAFKTRRGTYNITLNLKRRTVKIEPVSEPVVYVIGYVAGKEFAANQGATLNSADGKVYTGIVTFEGDDAQFVLSDKLASGPEEWTEIEKFTFGPTEDLTPLTEGAAGSFVGKPNAWSVKAGTYSITVNMETKTIELGDATGVESVQNNNGLKVYPTLTQGPVTIESDKAIGNVAVYTAAGNVVYSQGNVAQKQLTIDLSGKPAGLYILKINNEKSIKLIKK